MLGIIGGTSLLFSQLPPLKTRRVHTPYGPVDVQVGEVILLLRHQNSIPPHRINHSAHLSALALEGADRVIAFGSVGSLQPEIAPGSVLIPHDYIALGPIPTIHDHAISHILPEISVDLREDLSSVVPEARSGGVYVQTQGPRIETMSEVRMLSRIGDVVGMTIASEATLAIELGMRFAALCTVDNYAHGIGEEVPSWERILEAARGHQDRTTEHVQRIIDRMG